MFPACLTEERESPDQVFMQTSKMGEIYQGLMGKGKFLSQRWNLALGINTDGVSPYKSSTYQMWPIFWQILDLPPDLRFQTKYTRLCGLWFGKTKPVMNLFFNPFHSEIKRYYGQPILSFSFSFSFSSLLFPFLILSLVANRTRL